MDNTTNNYSNLTASAVLKTGAGALVGMYVNSTSSGTIKFFDGLTGTASAGVKATGVLTSSGVFQDTETVTIGNKVYTFVDTIVNHIDNQVLIGAAAADSLDNLKSAVNGSAGAGTTYSINTEAHSQVTATTNSDTEQTVEYVAVGLVGNAIATTETCDNVAWGAAVLENGVDTETLMNNTITPAVGYHELGNGSFTGGLYATIGGTLDVTLYYKQVALLTNR